MFGKLYDLLIDPLIDWLFGQAEEMFGYTKAVIEHVWEGLKYVISLIFGELWAWVLDMLPPEWAAKVNIDWDPYVQYFEDVNWILPVNEAFAVIVATYSLAAFIRLVRWLIGFIPTVEG